MRHSWLLLLFIAPICFGQAKKQITLENIYDGKTFRIKSVPGFNAMKDGHHYTQLDDENGHQVIHVYDLATGKLQKTLYAADSLKINDYSFSWDEKKLLLKTESQNIYRRSILYRTYVLDIKTGKVQMLDTAKVLHASFSPDGTKVAFVKDNNLFYKDLATGRTTAITTDGVKNKIINGNCDWVYEEEFAFTQAYQWSPNGKHIAYYRFDETNVPEYTFAVYDNLYPTNYTYKYPKAGEPNSVVQIKIYDIANDESINVHIGKETDQYIPRIKWTKDPSKLCIYRMNRLQNKMELLLADAADGRSHKIYTETNKYYVCVSDNLDFLPDGHSFVFDSEQEGFKHLYRWDWDREKLTDLTKGDYDVDEIIGVDSNRQLVYYTAAEKLPMERKLYSVNWNGKRKELLTPEDGTHSITTITGFNYFLDKYSTLTQPPVYYLRDADGNIVRTLEDNHELKETMQQFDLGKIRFKKVELSDKTLNAWMITPSGFDKTKKYPVLMYQYSGPASQEVRDLFPIRDFFWHQMLAEKGYIIVCVDGTGTGMRGEEFRKKTYLQLGKYESDDQIAAAKYLGTLPYIDKERIGIWGWSYGGFMSSTCIFKGNDVFKMAVSVAPVTNWRFYDNIYTERYMRTPQENPKGYDENAPEKMAGGLKGKFLLIHGTADDNVHFQNSAMLVNALVKANKDYDSEYYPNRNHGISGGNTRLHLYRRMTDFILKNL